MINSDSTSTPTAAQRVKDAGLGFGEHVVLLAVGAFALCAVYIGAGAVGLVPDSQPWATAALATVLYVGGYLAALALFERYDPTWVLPKGTEQVNFAVRHRFSFWVGIVAVLATVVIGHLYVSDRAVRAVMLAQSVLMSVSSANDLRRYRLPLPLSIIGLATAVVLLVLAQMPLWIVVFALVWAMALIALHVFVSRGDIGFSDHVAVLWIALCMPFNGMLMIVGGQTVLALLSRVLRWKNGRLPLGGVWLMLAAITVATPSFPRLLLADSASVSYATAEDTLQGSPRRIVPSGNGYTVNDLQHVQRLAREAGYLAGRVSFETDRSRRIQLATASAAQMAELERRTLLSGLPASIKNPVARSMGALGQALKVYDVTGVRLASAELAQHRRDLQSLAERMEILQVMLTVTPPTTPATNGARP
jgi:hypothetical protein